MADRLQVNFAGVKLRNPIILGSATPSWDGEASKKAGLTGVGAVVPKTIAPLAHPAQHPRCGRFHFIRYGRGRPFGMVNVELYSTMPPEEWLNRELTIAAQGGAKVIASIVAESALKDTVNLFQRVEATGLVDMFELNVSCPMAEAQEGHQISQDVEMVFDQTKAVKEVANLPVGVKMTPNLANMVPVAQAAKAAGADFLTISNSVKSLAGVDIETGKPYIPTYGGYSGPAIKPIVQRFVSEVAQAIDIPISAVGGVCTWEDVVEYIMLGATTVQTVTAVMWGGYAALAKLVNGLRRFMEDKGYNSIEDFRGIALPYITTFEEYAARPREHILLIRDKCNDCALCFRVCFYNALYLDSEQHLQTRPENCDGCGLCVEVCPLQALVLE